MSFTTYLVDDDDGVLKALSRLLRAGGYEAKPYRSPEEFLAEHDAETPGCVVLDLSMPGLDGLELQERLKRDGVERPIIFLTGTADIPASVQAMKAGAIDFLLKPAQRAELFAAVERAMEYDAKARQVREDREAFEGRLARLTPREREVLTYVVAGRLNKQIAAELGTVEKTIKVHRGRMMAKLGCRSVAELTRQTERVGLAPHQ